MRIGSNFAGGVPLSICMCSPGKGAVYALDYLCDSSDPVVAGMGIPCGRIIDPSAIGRGPGCSAHQHDHRQTSCGLIASSEGTEREGRRIGKPAAQSFDS